MRNLLLIAAFWFLFCSFSEDPIKISVRDILSSIQRERRITTNVQTIDYLNGLNYHLPMLKSLGFKYGTDDFTNTKRQYSTSLGFNGFKVIRGQEALKNAQINLYQAKRDALLNQVIQERYENLVNVYFSQTILDNQHLLDSLLNQKNMVLKTSLQNGISIRVKDLAETEDDINSLRVAAAEMNNVQTLSYQRIQDYVGTQSPFVLNFDNFISIAKLEEIVNTLKTHKNLQTPELRINQNRINLSQSELHLEEAQFKQFFDGFQLIYEQKNITDFAAKDFSFRVGFNVPIKGNFRPKQNELLLNIKENENELQLTTYEAERQLRTQFLLLENLIKQYKFSLENQNNSLVKNLMNTPSVWATLSAMDRVDLKIIQQKKTLETMKMQFALVNQYIKLLVMTGELTYSPYRNYLSNGLEKW